MEIRALILSIFKDKAVTAVVRIVEKTGDLEAPGDLTELVVCSVPCRGVIDSTSEALDIRNIASGIYAVSSYVPISIQNSILSPDLNE